MIDFSACWDANNDTIKLPIDYLNFSFLGLAIKGTAYENHG